MTLAEAEREHILGALRETGWVVAGPKGAAARLGMKRSNLQEKMRKLGIARPQSCRPAGSSTGLAALPTWHFPSSPQTGSTRPIHESLSMPPLRCEATDLGLAGTALALAVAGKGKRKASEGGPQTFR